MKRGFDNAKFDLFRSQRLDGEEFFDARSCSVHRVILGYGIAEPLASLLPSKGNPTVTYNGCIFTTLCHVCKGVRMKISRHRVEPTLINVVLE